MRLLKHDGIVRRIIVHHQKSIRHFVRDLRHPGKRTQGSVGICEGIPYADGNRIAEHVLHLMDYRIHPMRIIVGSILIKARLQEQGRYLHDAVAEDIPLPNLLLHSQGFALIAELAIPRVECADILVFVIDRKVWNPSIPCVWRVTNGHLIACPVEQNRHNL